MEKLQLDFTQTAIDQVFAPAKKKGSTDKFADKPGTVKPLDDFEEKYKLIADQLNIHQGARVLELSCCSSPFINYLTEKRGAKPLSISSSETEYEEYRKKELATYINDFRTITRADFGTFDALLSVDMFGKICSLDQYLDGKQDSTYQHFFNNAANLLPAGGRLYLQTLVLAENLNINMNKTLAFANLPDTVIKTFGACIPFKTEIIRNAVPYFRIISMSSDKYDFIKSIAKRRKLFSLFGRDSLRSSLKNGMLDHFTIILEKI